jgi:hypothetical protein
MKIKKRIGMLTACLLGTHVLTATCTINPLNYTGRVVSGSFGSEENNAGRTSMAMFRGTTNQSGVKTAYLDVYNYGGSLYTPWQLTGFDVDKITDRVVSGDFDSDGELNDIAAIYDHGNGVVSLRTWMFDLPTVVTYDASAWAPPFGSGYDATKVTGRVVAGDFDTDRIYDDIAAFYDYGNGNTKIHLWIGTHGEFTYHWWWESGGYNCNLITGRVVSGDFDRDTYLDDIATLYDYGNGAMRIHVFTGPGTIWQTPDPDGDFTYSNGADGWWSTPSGYTPSNITFRVVSGNFDHSGIGTGKIDDIVAIYDYGNGAAKAHVWTSTGNSFNYSWKWEVTGFTAPNITDRFVTFDTDPNTSPERCSGMAALYNYGAGTNMVYHWQAWSSLNGNWNFASFTGYICPQRLSEEAASADEVEITPALSVDAFPNPNDGHVTVEIAPTEEGMTSLSIIDLAGREVFSSSVNAAAGLREEIDLTAFGKGVYILRVVSPGNKTETRKLIVQ